MRYSKSDSEYFRTKKGGGLETSGKLNAANFNRKKNNKLREINIRQNANTVELPEMNSSGKYKIKPIKIMVKKKSLFKFSSEHYIFFGLNPETDIYEYVIYLNPDFSTNGGSPIICKKRNEDGTIVEIKHEDFLKINIKELSILIYNLLLINQQNNKLLHQNFFQYLLDYVLPKILKRYQSVNNTNLRDIVGKIKQILRIKNNENNNPELPPKKNNENNNVALPPRRKK